MPRGEPDEHAGRDTVAGRRVVAPGARPRVGVVGILGELLLTVGALTLLFLGWQLWWNDAIMASQQSDATSDLSAAWVEQGRAEHEADEPVVAPAPTGTDHGEPVVDRTDHGTGDPFAIMYVPRFGEGSQRTIAEGVGLDVLNSFETGVGHYPGTQMPGELGNFAIAAHRSAYGGGMHEIEQLQLGDAIHIQTRDAWYTYRFRDL
jgi:sortase A